MEPLRPLEALRVTPKLENFCAGGSEQTLVREGGFHTLRERGFAHLESTRLRPVSFNDESQEMTPSALSELRLLASVWPPSQTLLCVILAGDACLAEKLQREELLPLENPIRTRLVTEYASRDELPAAWTI